MKKEYTVYLERFETASITVEADNKAHAEEIALQKDKTEDWEGDWETRVTEVEEQ